MSTNTIEASSPKRPPTPRNGVDTPKLFATIAVVADQPSLAEFRFRAQGRWMGGTHSRTTISGFYGVGGEMRHVEAIEADSDHPSVLCGEDRGPTPVEWLLHALAGCLTAGIANIAAARGVSLGSVACDVEGDMDLRGILGLSRDVRNGFRAIQVRFRVTGDAPAETLRKIVEQSRARSAVFDVLTNGVPVDIKMNS
ncbi:OsmC family protein [Sabulicella glaciei]|uniref:OsmC family protein n=1 Tax=Sabulicella glaciei TaxID=2984948 RepID=A0ABT3NS79_9PROT|nr:OsmC family protein [Roseococcus sp. MDT2-1-1]MCW8085020.1 OsmC family protein [Roseococcus sp. MDT2-1-1]